MIGNILAGILGVLCLGLTGLLFAGWLLFMFNNEDKTDE